MAREHGSKEWKNLRRQMERAGFTVEQSRSGTWRIKPPAHIDGPIYTTHGTTRCIKPIIRDFRRFYGIDLAP